MQNAYYCLCELLVDHSPLGNAQLLWQPIEGRKGLAGWPCWERGCVELKCYDERECSVGAQEGLARVLGNSRFFCVILPRFLVSERWKVG